MISLGEMIAYLPIPGGHIKLAERFVDPALSFTMGWNYWYNWTIILPAELSAAATLMHFWVDAKWDPLWIVICFLVVLCINLLGAGVCFRDTYCSILDTSSRCIRRSGVYFRIDQGLDCSRVDRELLIR